MERLSGQERWCQPAGGSGNGVGEESTHGKSSQNIQTVAFGESIAVYRGDS